MVRVCRGPPQSRICLSQPFKLFVDSIHHILQFLPFSRETSGVFFFSFPPLITFRSDRYRQWGWYVVTSPRQVPTFPGDKSLRAPLSAARATMARIHTFLTFGRKCRPRIQSTIHSSVSVGGRGEKDVEKAIDSGLRRVKRPSRRRRRRQRAGWRRFCYHLLFSFYLLLPLFFLSFSFSFLRGRIYRCPCWLAAITASPPPTPMNTGDGH